ncbi:hypothetical protein F5Y19DRAFT_474905 [Xylariaceae sp. FL1651]|nr:hypothetical protein F5Y19DRAFT_474905 [Xylariaceae sp. FL1651]
MADVSIPPSPTLTADELAESHETPVMLEVYLSEEPTLPERLLMSTGKSVTKERVDAARRQINTFDLQWSK